MQKKVIGISGWKGSGKKTAGKFFESRGFFRINCFEILQQLFQPGEEGYRQILNYFGEEFLLKSGMLNQRKLWKFVYSDLHKLKILDFLLQPLLIDRCQKIMDGTERCEFVIEQTAFVDQNWDKILTQKIWLERTENLKKDQQIEESRYLSLVQILDVQKRLYKKPQTGFICLTNNSSISQLKKQLLGLE